MGQMYFPNERRNTWIYWFFILLFLGTTVIATIMYINENRSKEFYNDQYCEMINETESLKKEIEKAQKRIVKLETEIANISPIIITDVEIGNVDINGVIKTKHGNTLYADDVMMFSPKVFYRCFRDDKYVIKTKWYRPDGSLITGQDSSDGYSQIEEYSFYKNSDEKCLIAWGYEKKGLWFSGEYKLEIWYDNRCLFIKFFNLVDYL